MVMVMVMMMTMVMMMMMVMMIVGMWMSAAVEKNLLVDPKGASRSREQRCLERRTANSVSRPLETKQEDWRKASLEDKCLMVGV